VLHYGGNRIISKMYDFLYHDATIFLPRKEIIARKAKELAVMGIEGRKRKKRKSALPITKEILLEKARELKSGKKIGEFFGCSGSNICFLIKSFGIREEYNQAIIKLEPSLIYQQYQELGSYSKVGRKFGVTRDRISKIVKEFTTNPNQLLLPHS
jgi:hypothetical protein